MARRSSGGGGMGLLILGAAALFLLSKKGAEAAVHPAAAAAAPINFYSGPTPGGPAVAGGDFGTFDYGQSLLDTAIGAGVDVGAGIISDFSSAISAGLSALIAPSTP